MADDILNMYGNDSGAAQKPRATNGGCCEAKELPYSEPVGPKGQMHKGVGLGGTNHGTSVMQGKH